MGAGEFCAHFCCLVGIIGIFFYIIMIVMIQGDNEYLMSVNHKDNSINAFIYAGIVFALFGVMIL
jgi:hypothetical protein